MIYRDEGWRGLYRGTTLALVGVSNGALQFMAYEKMKSWAFERKRRRFAQLGRAWTIQDEKLVPSLVHLDNTGLAFLLTFGAVKHDVHHHVGRIENRRAVRDVPVPSDPLAYPGDD